MLCMADHSTVKISVYYYYKKLDPVNIRNTKARNQSVKYNIQVRFLC